VSHSQAITDFQLSCQKYYICYSLAALGLMGHADKFKQLKPNRSNSLIVGTGHPDDGKWHGSINIAEFLDSSQRNGAFSDSIAKSFVSAIYSSWDEYFRNIVAAEVGAKQKQVKSDLMGDLRHVRNCIIHKKSVLTDEPSKIKTLSWSLSPGPLVVTDEMFRDLIDQINHMAVAVEPEQQ
jgi:hypothetical protein